MGPKEGTSSGIGYIVGRMDIVWGGTPSPAYMPPPPDAAALPDLTLHTPQASVAAVRCFDGLNRDGRIGRHLQRELHRQAPPSISLSKEFERLMRPAEEVRGAGSLGEVAGRGGVMGQDQESVLAAARPAPMPAHFGAEWERPTHRLTVETIRENAYDRGYDCFYLQENEDNNVSNPPPNGTRPAKKTWSCIDTAAPSSLELHALDLERLAKVDLYPRQLEVPPRWAQDDYEPDIPTPELRPRPGDEIQEVKYERVPKSSKTRKSVQTRSSYRSSATDSTKEGPNPCISTVSKDSITNISPKLPQNMVTSRKGSIEDIADEMPSKDSIVEASKEDRMDPLVVVPWKAQLVPYESNFPEGENEDILGPKGKRLSGKSLNFGDDDMPAILEPRDSETESQVEGECAEVAHCAAGTLALFVQADEKLYEIRPPGAIRAWRKDFDRERQKKLAGKEGVKFTPSMEKRPRFERKNV